MVSERGVVRHSSKTYIDIYIYTRRPLGSETYRLYRDICICRGKEAEYIDTHTHTQSVFLSGPVWDPNYNANPCIQGTPAGMCEGSSGIELLI